MGLKARDSCNVRDHNWGDLPLSTAISAVKGQKPEIMKRKEAGEVGFGSEMPFIHPVTQELSWIWRLQNPSQVWGGCWWRGGLFTPWAADGGGSCVSAGFPCPTFGLPERFWDPNLECLTTKTPSCLPLRDWVLLGAELGRLLKIHREMQRHQGFMEHPSRQESRNGWDLCALEGSAGVWDTLDGKWWSDGTINVIYWSWTWSMAGLWLWKSRNIAMEMRISLYQEIWYLWNRTWDWVFPGAPKPWNTQCLLHIPGKDQWSITFI